jgi:hypothetical protein
LPCADCGGRWSGRSPWSRSRPWKEEARPTSTPSSPTSPPPSPVLPPLHRALQHRLVGTPRSGAAAPGRCRCGSHGPRRPASSAPGRSTLLVTTSSPPCPEREVSTEAFTLLWTRPSSRGWTEPYGLAVCLMTAVPHRAAAQTRRRLRAGHRAEPVTLQVPLSSSPRALPCLAMVSYLCSDERTPSSGSPSAPTH